MGYVLYDLHKWVLLSFYIKQETNFLGLQTEVYFCIYRRTGNIFIKYLYHFCVDVLTNMENQSWSPAEAIGQMQKSTCGSVERITTNIV